MAYLTSAPRGTKDILPVETPKWQYLEKTLQELRTIQAEKQRESVLLEVFLAECERSVQKLETLLADWPQD